MQSGIFLFYYLLNSSYLIYIWYSISILCTDSTMQQYEALIATLKKSLKKAGLTYADVARQTEQSEANVKRMFAEQKFTLEKLENICRLIGFDIIELVRLYDESRDRISFLSEQQEKELISDVRLLMIAVAVRNKNSYQQILEYYDIDEHECIQYLARLDRLKLIELLPGNRIRLLIDEDFNWLPNGPIERFFQKEMQNEFLATDFARENEFRVFLSGTLSDTGHEVLLRKLKQLCIEFRELNKQDLKTDNRFKKSESLLIAFRPWEYSRFKQFSRS